MSTGEEIRNERIQKLSLLREAGMEGYPTHTNRTMDIHAFVADFSDLLESQAEHTLAGRIMSRRGQGGIIFADLFDGTARTQVVLQEVEMPTALFELFSTAVDTGDFIEVTGPALLTKRGERSLKVARWRMLAKSLRPIPDEWFGLKDDEKRLREREIDILVNQELRAIFVRRAKFWQTIRSFLSDRGFLEVETPVLENSPGGADARPFITHHNALDIDVYLRICAGELWQKRLLVAGFPKVFEIGRIFRNEGQSAEHLQDYTQVELYEAYSDMARGMEMVRDLYRRIAMDVYGAQVFTMRDFEVNLAGEWPVLDYRALLDERFGIDPVHCTEDEAVEAAKRAGVTLSAPNKPRVIDALWKSIRKGIGGPAFLVGIPVFLEPLAKRSADGETVERFQVILAGSEIGKGFSELNDPQDQYERFAAQEALRQLGDDEAQRMDEEFVRALEYGMPPAFGFGVSERLFAFLENKPAHETQLFPLLRPRL